MKYGFIKVASAIPSVKVGDVVFNAQQIEDLIAQAEGKGVEIITFPELSITGYSCQDLFRQQMLLETSEQAVMMLLDFTRKLDIISIVGAPVVAGDLLLNCGIVIQHGQILGVVPKTYLPNYSEFYEKRWFASAQDLRDCEVRYAGHKVKLTFIRADHEVTGIADFAVSQVLSRSKPALLLSTTLTALPSLTGSVPLGTSLTIGVSSISSFKARVTSFCNLARSG